MSSRFFIPSHFGNLLSLRFSVWILCIAIPPSLSIDAFGEVPDVKEVLNQAIAAAEAINIEKLASTEAKKQFDKMLYEKTWEQIASTQCRIGQYDEARLSYGKIYPQRLRIDMALQAHRLENEGVLMPDPEGIPPRMEVAHRNAIIGYFASRGNFEKALEQTELIRDEAAKKHTLFKLRMTQAEHVRSTDREMATRFCDEAAEFAAESSGTELLDQFYVINQFLISIENPEAAVPSMQLLEEAIDVNLKQLGADTACQDLLRIGYQYIQCEKPDEATRCFAKAKSIYESAGNRWEMSMPCQQMYNHQCYAFSQLKDWETLEKTLEKWETAYGSLKDLSSIHFVATKLILHETRAKRWQMAEGMLRKISVVARLKSISEIAEQMDGEGWNEQRRWLAKQALASSADEATLTIAYLIVCADLLKAAKAESTEIESVIDNAIADSVTKAKEYHPLIAGWLAENALYSNCYDLIQQIEVPVQRGLPLSQLALSLANDAAK